MPTAAMTANGRPESPAWVTTQELAEYLRLHPKTVLRLAKEHVIPCLRAGQAIRFRPDEVEAALRRPGALDVGP